LCFLFPSSEQAYQPITGRISRDPTSPQAFLCLRLTFPAPVEYPKTQRNHGSGNKLHLSHNCEKW
jgi:hypothetical protein